jgi:hypothetical protein
MIRDAFRPCAIGLLMAIAATPSLAWSVKKTYEPAPTYSVEVKPGCVVSIALSKHSAPGYALGFGRGGACGLDVSDEMPAVNAILRELAHDEVKLWNFHAFALGRVTEQTWKRRIADCYVARFGMNDPRAHEFKELDACDVFRELRAAFAHDGADLRFADMEEWEFLDLRKRRDRQLAIELNPRWAHAVDKSRGLILSVGVIYFRIVPSSIGRAALAPGAN